MIRLALFALAVFFSLCACRPMAPPTDAGAVAAPSADSGSATAVVVDPAALTAAAVVIDGGTSVVMPEAKVQRTTTVTAPATPVDLKADAKAKAEAAARAAALDKVPMTPMAP